MSVGTRVEGNRFEIELNWEVEDDVFMPLRVLGRITPWLPAIRPSWNEPGQPGEGRELEDLKVFSGSRLDPILEASLLGDDRFMRAVEAAL